MKQSVVDKKIDDKETQELKKLENHYLDKRTDFLKKPQIKVEDVRGVNLKIYSVSPEQITKLNNFLAEMM